MNTSLFRQGHRILIIVSLWLAALNTHGQGTTFTYQGRLDDNGGAANGIYDFRFRIFSAAAGGSVIAGPLATNGVVVTNGLFTLALDFGAGVFTGPGRWMESAVRTNGAPSFTTLDARLPLNPSPYAMFAATASNATVAVTATTALTATTATSATTAMTASNVAPGSVTGAGVASNSLLAVNLASGQVMKSLNGQTDAVNITGDGGLTVAASSGVVKLNPNAWSLAGNTNTSPTNGNFLGTSDNQPLELRVNNLRAVRLEIGASNSPNVIIGALSNFVVTGAGGASVNTNSPGTNALNVNGNLNATSFTGNGSGLTALTPANLSGGTAPISITGNAATATTATASVIAGTATNFSGALAGDVTGTQGATVVASVGGQSSANVASGVALALAATSTNTASTIVARDASGNFSAGTITAVNFSGNGSSLAALNPANLASGTAPISITGNAATATTATASVIAGTATNFSGALAGDVTGTQGATVVASVGGQSSANVASGISLALAATSANTANAIVARDASGNFSAGTVTAVNFVGNGSGLTGISGGTTASNAWALGGNNVSAGQFLGSTNNVAVDVRANNVRALRLEPNTNGFPNFIAGAPANFVATNITGAAIAGGAGNTNGGDLSFIAGGASNATAGALSFAAGQRAKANHRGTFVWADSQGADFASSGTNQFLIRAQGGTGINTTNLGTATFSVLGNQTGGWSNAVSVFQNTNTGANIGPALRVVAYGSNTDGALSVSANGTGLIARFGNALNWVGDITTNGTFDGLVFNPTSDRNAKQDFQPVNPRIVLEKIAALPISEWNYKLAPGEQHIGPMAQDFRAAFGLGVDDKHIATVDADGVALAAIQGLNLKLAEELKRRDAENAELKTRVEKLEKLLNEKFSGGDK